MTSINFLLAKAMANVSATSTSMQQDVTTVGGHCQVPQSAYNRMNVKNGKL